MQKREQLLMNNKNLQSPLPNAEQRLASMSDNDEIQVTPNSGLTSITNTNVLMNETLERMKFSLNKINMQLLETEKKGPASLDDPDMEALRLQLFQTEAQMSKIMNIVNVFSDSIESGERQLAEQQRRAELQKQARRIAKFNVNADHDEEDDEEEDENDLVEQVFQADADNEEEEIDEEGNFYNDDDDDCQYEKNKSNANEECSEEEAEANFEEVKIRYRGAAEKKGGPEESSNLKAKEETASINIYNNMNPKPVGKNAARNRKRKNKKNK